MLDPSQRHSSADLHIQICAEMRHSSPSLVRQFHQHPQQRIPSPCSSPYSVSPPNRRPSVGSYSNREFAQRSKASPSISRKHRRPSCSAEWRSNTFTSGDDGAATATAFQQRVVMVVEEAWNSGQVQMVRGGSTTAIYGLREAMRELTRPSVQLFLGVSASPATPTALQQPQPKSSSSSMPPSSPSRRHSRPRSPPSGSSHQLPVGGCGVNSARSPSFSGPTTRRSSTLNRLERSNSIVGGRGGNSLAFLPELSPQQVACLRRSWKHINTKGLYDVVRRSFRKVESANPSVLAAFRQNGAASNSSPAREREEGAAPVGEPQQQKPRHGLMEHTRYFLALLDRIIEGDHEDVERELKMVGARHVALYERFGVGVAEIERTGEALAESLFKLDGIRQSKETTKVWRTLIAHIIDHIRDGFDTELRVRRRTSTLMGAGAIAAPLECRFFKRNSVPEQRQTSKSSPRPACSSNSRPSNSHQQPHGSAAASNSHCSFLRTELANLTRKLSNL